MENRPPIILHREHWLSAKQYAEACGIQTRSVFLRHRRKVIVATRIDGMLIVDAALSPPTAMVRGHAPQAPPFAQPGNMPPIAALERVSHFCQRNGISGHAIYHDILIGRIRVWCFAQRVFFQPTPEMDRYLAR